MKLQTKVDIEPFAAKIDYQSRLFTIGSCFADRVGREMLRAKLRVALNPSGVLFNPISVCSTLERFAAKRFVDESELHQGGASEPAWYHFDFHSSLSRDSREETLRAINEAIDRGHCSLERADWVVVTLGTSWVYELADSGVVVANCHKRPSREFCRRRLSVEEVVQSLGSVIEGALAGKRVVLTLSPIRHIGDGLVENSLSKSILRVAIEQICERFERVVYFPAYEIVMDELRDYRFYEQDMCHISPLAVEYIWERFSQTALSHEAQETLPRVLQVVRGVEHRAVNPHSKAHRAFVESQIRAIKSLPKVDFSEELEEYEDFLKINF